MTLYPSRYALTFLLTTSMACLATSGCGFKIEKHEPESEISVTPKGADSPMAAFEAFRNAANKGAAEGDFDEMISYVTDETAQLLAGHMLLRGAMATATANKSRPITRVLDKHDVGKGAMDKIQQQPMTEIPDQAAIYSLAADIKNKRRFVAEMMEAFQTLGLPVPLTGFKGEVNNWQIQDDKAVGLIEQPDGKRERIAFLRTEAGWQVHFAVRSVPASARTSGEGSTEAPPAGESPNTPPAQADESQSEEQGQ